MRRNFWLIPVWVLTISIAGCQSESDRVAEVARESAQRQAEQSKQMAQLQGFAAPTN